ncbi:MAG: DUF2155 domain-containing protein [Acetobacteraceae bacterium]|nr:DUF2155 domain-containing protein [Acetobacteraceae bacterium]
MKLAGWTLLASLAPMVGAAQPAPIVTAPLPPTRQYPQAEPQAPTRQYPQAQPQAPAPSPAPVIRPAPPPAATVIQPISPPEKPAALASSPWLPQGGAVLQALDKVNTQTATLTVRPGHPARFGALTIQVKECVVRPPDMPQDAAAYLTITDAHADEPSFQGWILKSAPALSMMQHPIYDIRVLGCQS